MEESTNGSLAAEFRHLVGRPAPPSLLHLVSQDLLYSRVAPCALCDVGGPPGEELLEFAAGGLGNVHSSSLSQDCSLCALPISLFQRHLLWGAVNSVKYSMNQCAHKLSVCGSSRTCSRLWQFLKRLLLLHILTIPSHPSKSGRPQGALSPFFTSSFLASCPQPLGLALCLQRSRARAPGSRNQQRGFQWVVPSCLSPRRPWGGQLFCRCVLGALCAPCSRHPFCWQHLVSQQTHS